MIDYYITPEEYEIAESNGIKRTTLEQRVWDLLWDKEKAITTPPKKISSGYEDYKEIAKLNGVKSNTFYRRIQRGWSPVRAANIKTKDVGKDFLDKQREKSIKKTRKYPNWVYEELEKNNIHRSTFWQRVNKRGWSVEDACTTPIQEKGKYDRSNHVFRKYDKLTFLGGIKCENKI